MRACTLNIQINLRIGTSILNFSETSHVSEENFGNFENFLRTPLGLETVYYSSLFKSNTTFFDVC